MKEIVYLNGKMVPATGARLSINDHGFLYGYGLFETMRAYDGKIFMLDWHLQRLMGSAGPAGLGERLLGVDLDKVCKDVLAVNGHSSARLRITITGGATGAFPWMGDDGQLTVLVTARPFTPPPAKQYERGYRAMIASLRRCSQTPLSGVKSVSYIVSVLAKREATAAGADEALLLNDEGYLAEGGSTNVFFVKEGRLVTPSRRSGILPGITREIVIELAKEKGIPVSEGTVGISTIKQSQEAFLTASTLEVMPLTEVRDAEGNTAKVGDGKPGDVTRILMAAYKERVAGELGL